MKDLEIKSKIAQLAHKTVEQIQVTDNLVQDLGLNSLDITELVVFLEEHYHKQASFEDLITVGDAISFANGEKERVTKKEKIDHKIWQDDPYRRPISAKNASTLFEYFLQTCDLQPNAIACADKGIVSYIRLKSLILGLVPIFSSLEAERIGVLLPSSIEGNTVILALMMAKKIPVLLNWTLGSHHLEQVYEEASLTHIISSFFFIIHSKLEIKEYLRKAIIPLDNLIKQASIPQRKEAIELSRLSSKELMTHLGLEKVSPEKTAVILFTSGSEKKPKGVPLSHKNILTNQLDAIGAINLQASDIILGLLPSFHVFGFSITNILPLLMGCRVVYQPNPLDFPLAIDNIHQFQITVLCTTPTFLKALLALAPPEKLKSIRLFIVGAEKAPPELFQKVNALPHKPQIIEGYGITECSPIVTLNHLHSPPKGVGFPLSHISLSIVDPETYKPLEKGETGLILVHGPNVFSGYLRQELDPFITLQGVQWYKTGDIGYLDDVNALHLSGRLSHTIKRGGEMISLVSIEDVFRQEKKEAKLAVIADKKDHLVLCIDIPIELDEANRILQKAGFSNLFRLDRVQLFDPFPLLPTGKINYRFLKEYIK